MRKGMSQVLALIVAASVLMMTALTVIFLTQGSLSGIGEQSTWNTCKSTVETKCEIQSYRGDISTPSACTIEGGKSVLTKAETQFGATPSRIQCSDVKN